MHHALLDLDIQHLQPQVCMLLTLLKLYCTPKTHIPRHFMIHARAHTSHLDIKRLVLGRTIRLGTVGNI